MTALLRLLAAFRAALAANQAAWTGAPTAPVSVGFTEWEAK